MSDPLFAPVPAANPHDERGLLPAALSQNLSLLVRLNRLVEQPESRGLSGARLLLGVSLDLTRKALPVSLPARVHLHQLLLVQGLVTMADQLWDGGDQRRARLLLVQVERKLRVLETTYRQWVEWAAEEGESQRFDPSAVRGGAELAERLGLRTGGPEESEDEIDDEIDAPVRVKGRTA